MLQVKEKVKEHHLWEMLMLQVKEKEQDMVSDPTGWLFGWLVRLGKEPTKAKKKKEKLLTFILRLPRSLIHRHTKSN